VLPSGEAPAPELTGATIKADVEAIVDIARESRTTREIGSGQMWGRVTGLPSGTKAVTWSADQFRKAGIQDVRIQPITMEPNARFWFPLSWEVRLLADPAFGPGTADVVLESAIPLAPSDIPGGTLTAPIVYVGSANPSILQHIDVTGKIAVQLTIPQGHMVFERGPVGSRADDLVARGAAGVFNLVRLPATSDRAISATAATRASTSAAATGISSRRSSIARPRPEWPTGCASGSRSSPRRAQT
jgi:hypothetical protein